MVACECQAWQRMQEFLFLMQIGSVICANLLEQMKLLKCLHLKDNLQNWQPIRKLKSYDLQKAQLVTSPLWTGMKIIPHNPYQEQFAECQLQK